MYIHDRTSSCFKDADAGGESVSVITDPILAIRIFNTRWTQRSKEHVQFVNEFNLQQEILTIDFN